MSSAAFTTSIPDLPAYRVGIAGSGTHFHAFARLICRPDFSDAFPWITIEALACLDENALQAVPCLTDVPIYTTIEALFKSHPDLNVVLDLSETGELMQELKVNAPHHCSVLHGNVVESIWELLISERLCHTCMRDLRRAQNLFTTLIDQVDEDILLLNPKGEIVDINRSLLQRKGGSKQDYIGRHCSSVEGENCCPQNGEGDHCTYKETLSTGAKAEHIHSKVNDDGRMQYFRTYTYPVYGQDGSISRIIELRRDITHRTYMEQKLQQSEKMAAIGELSTYIAHEIRNPLFAIGGFANSLLRSPSLDESAREKVEIILQESKRLDAILKSTLNFARPTDPAKQELDLNRITADTLQLMQIGCEKRGLSASVMLTPEIAIAKGDADLMKQCIINLVKNSIEAMEEGGRLTVTTGMTSSHVFISVEDTGHGIPDHLRDKVFSPFFSTKDKGAGLGLAMTKKIIEEMGGAVELVSQENTGTRITLKLLPMLAVDDPDIMPSPDTGTSIDFKELNDADYSACNQKQGKDS